jgi:hypothetical protein
MSTIELGRVAALTRPVERHDELLAHDRPVILHLPDLLSAEYSDQVTSRLRALALTPYEATLGSDDCAPIPKLGPALFEYHEEMLQDRSAGLTSTSTRPRLIRPCCGVSSRAARSRTRSTYCTRWRERCTVRR